MFTPLTIQHCYPQQTTSFVTSNILGVRDHYVRPNDAPPYVQGADVVMSGEVFWVEETAEEVRDMLRTQRSLAGVFTGTTNSYR